MHSRAISEPFVVGKIREKIRAGARDAGDYAGICSDAESAGKRGKFAYSCGGCGKIRKNRAWLITDAFELIKFWGNSCGYWRYRSVCSMRENR